jgi:hypothetical protein
MKKQIYWLIIGLCLVAVAVLLFSLVQTKRQTTSMNSVLENFKDVTIVTQVAGQLAIQDISIANQATQTTLQNQVATLQTQVTNDQVQLNALSNENVRLTAFFDCANKDTFQPDYSSNLAMQKALKSFVNKITGLQVQDAPWETIWSGANSSLYYIYFFRDNQRIKLPYIVFFIEKGMNLKQGVFDVNNQCWLNR